VLSCMLLRSVWPKVITLSGFYCLLQNRFICLPFVLTGIIGDSEQGEKTEVPNLQKVFQSSRSSDMSQESLFVSKTPAKSSRNGIPVNELYPLLDKKKIHRLLLLQHCLFYFNMLRVSKVTNTCKSCQTRIQGTQVMLDVH